MINIIAAISKNRVIGKDGRLIYKIPKDFKRMVNLTKGHPIIMGRKTFESKEIGKKALPNRTNIIVTRQADYNAENCKVVHSIEEALEVAKKAVGAEEIFIFGGASIYREALQKDIVDKIYLTVVDDECKGDTLFPKIDENKWELIERETHSKDKQNKYNFEFRTYQRAKIWKERLQQQIQ